MRPSPRRSNSLGPTTSCRASVCSNPARLLGRLWSIECELALLLQPMLLAHLEDIIYKPIQYEPRGEPPEHEGKHDRHHPQHDLRLLWIAHARGHLLLEEHAGAHKQRQKIEGILFQAPHVEREERIRLREVLNPEEWRAPHLD